jgi:hypothetical protein
MWLSRLAWLFAVWALAGCATETIKLYHPTTQASVTCGPYSHWPSVILAEIRVRDCVKDYQQAGYQRAP